MNKVNFLNHLSKRLQVLKQNERDDLLAEYMQHIELKIASGLDEEEAIRDFGDVDELADELLDVYHVNPDYGKNSLKNPLAGVGGKVKGGFGSVWKTMKAALGSMGAGCVIWFKKIGNLWKPNKKVAMQVEQVQGEGVPEECPLWKRLFYLNIPKRVGTKRESGEENQMFQRVRRTSVSLMEWLKRVVIVCWKLCVAAFLAPIIGCDFLAVILLGTLIVVILLGYPLIGMALMTLGSLLCGITLVWFIWLVVFSKKEV